MCGEARKDGVKGGREYTGKGEETYFYKGMKFVFVEDGVWPVLKTIF
jgi:hypothetical protein